MTKNISIAYIIYKENVDINRQINDYWQRNKL